MPFKSQTEIKDQINVTLENIIRQQKKRAAEIHPNYFELWETIENLVMAGGKRIRPYLTYVAYTMFNQSDEEDIYIVAAAQEFLHFALLIHDDIIDRDTIRYGRKNIMGTYAETYTKAGIDTDHFASGAALLAGDLALSQAYDLILQSNFSSQKKSQAAAHLSQSIFHVAAGELLDMEAAFHQPAADYFTIAKHKTAHYSFIGPLVTGASLASAPVEDIKALEDLGLQFGIAYQLSDDLLGLYGNEEEIGKPVVSDLREGKKTHLFNLIHKSTEGKDREYFARAWGNPNVSKTDVERVRQLGIKTEAKSRVEELIHDYADKSLAILASMNLSQDNQEPLQKLIQKLINRKI